MASDSVPPGNQSFRRSSLDPIIAAAPGSAFDKSCPENQTSKLFKCGHVDDDTPCLEPYLQTHLPLRASHEEKMRVRRHHGSEHMYCVRTLA
eukprot:3363589-Rhodomonas_salina.3